MIPVGVACSCLVVSYLCVYATGKGWWLVFGVTRALTLTLVLTTGLITIFILVISVIGKWSRAQTNTNQQPLTLFNKKHP